MRSALFNIFFPDISARRTAVALLVLRFFVGTAFLFHGYGKIVDIDAFASEFNLPLSVAMAAAYTQFVGGLLLIVGFLTPLAGISLGGTMAVAALTLIQRGEPFVNPHGHSWEPASFYLVVSMTVAFLGPGLFSVDGVLTRGRLFRMSAKDVM